MCIRDRNTCWVALTYGKSAASVLDGEKEICVISLGYGKTQGVPHKSKPIEKLCNYSENLPDWFLQGMRAAMLAPTATNQQKFRFELLEDCLLYTSLLAALTVNDKFSAVKIERRYIQLLQLRKPQPIGQKQD